MKTSGISLILLLCFATLPSSPQAKLLSTSIRSGLLTMTTVCGETDASLTYEHSSWRDEIWPYYSRVPWDSHSTICATVKSTGFMFDQGAYPEAVGILASAVSEMGPLPRTKEKPSFALKGMSPTDTALVLVSLRSGMVQVSLSGGLVAHGRLTSNATQRLARILARAGGQVALAPRKTDTELRNAAQSRDRWQRECPDCLLPPRESVVYYDTAVRPLTPLVLPDSLRGDDGRVLLWVSTRGTAQEARFYTSSPWNDAILPALKWQALRFKPATSAGEPVGAWVEFNFRGK